MSAANQQLIEQYSESSEKIFAQTAANLFLEQLEQLHDSCQSMLLRKPGRCLLLKSPPLMGSWSTKEVERKQATENWPPQLLPYLYQRKLRLKTRKTLRSSALPRRMQIWKKSLSFKILVKLAFQWMKKQFLVMYVYINFFKHFVYS